MVDYSNKIEMNEIHIYSWGFSKYGQTGLDNCQYTDEPNKLFIPLIKKVKSISNGKFNSSFIFEDNKSYLYGLNTFGQLGNGGHHNKSKKLSSIPLIISQIKFIKLSLGGGHILGLSNNKKLYSWGLNIFGQLGLGHNENIDQPTLVEKIAYFDSQSQEYDSTNNILKETTFQNNQNIIDIKAGPQHSLILLSDNSLYSCGFAKFGALGYYFNNNFNDNEPNDNNIFTKIDLEKNYNFKSDIEKITKIAAGFAHSGCVINDKFIFIWGNNKDLKINGYKKFNISKIMKKINIENNTKEEIIIKDFQIGKDFAVILTNTGIVLTEGDNSLGQLGKQNYDLNNENNEIFGNVEIPEKIINISVGYEFVYAISENKKIYAWGCNKFGQIPGYNKNICNEPIYLEKITNLNPILISCGGYHISALCNSETNLNDTVKYFKNIPLNKCFNYDDFRKREIYYDRIGETVEAQQQRLDEIDKKEKEYQKMLKEFEKKEKIKQLKEMGKENEIMEPEDYENVEIEKLLDEEIRFEELVFPKDCLIGSGAFGEVKRAYWRKTLVSVKFLKTSLENKEKQIIQFIEEYNLLKHLRHPNILLYIGGNISGNQHFLVTEYCENGNLFEFLHGKDAPILEDIERINLALEIAQGINYLHSFKPPILHRDLKSLNILLDKNYVCKIADFGWAKLRDNHMTKLRGTFQWMAPEVITNEYYTEKADVYSFGIILWEFWSRDPPYKGVKAKDVAKKVRVNKTYRPIIPNDVPKEIAELMECCWDADPDKRPTFLEIINFLDEIIRNM